VIVLLAIGIAGVVLASLQISALRQAMSGRESVAKVRAKWGARAGLEAVIARMANATQSPSESSGYALYDNLVQVSIGELEGVTWSIEHWEGSTKYDGPEDPHTKVNVNRMEFEDLMELRGMTEDVADAIVRWRGGDPEAGELGGYAALNITPRNSSFRSLQELELIINVDPQLLRGEDWNLNGRLDPNEDDGDLTWPPDNADGRLDAGWSGLITAASIDEGLAFSGQERLYLPDATENELQLRVRGITPLQAQAILAHARTAENLESFLTTPLGTLAQRTGEFNEAERRAIQALTLEQQTDLFAELTMRNPEDGPAPGKINLNLVRREVLDYIQPFRENPGLADQIIFIRNQRPQGFVHLTDLLQYVGPAQLAVLSRYIDVQSNAFVVTSRGIDVASGIEVEIQATVARTALPIVIMEMTIR
jgi:DNA uptake protein ComE-like DNA-binding protein